MDPSASSNYAIEYASKRNHPLVVQLLLKDSRVDPAARRNTAIITSSLFGHFEVVQLLLQDSRVDPAAQDYLAIKRASDDGHLSVVELLLQDQRVDPSACDNELLRRAAAKPTTSTSKLEVFKLLLSDPRVVLHICWIPFIFLLAYKFLYNRQLPPILMPNLPDARVRVRVSLTS